MKISIILLMFFLSPLLFGQPIEDKTMFSKYYFSALGGLNFNTLPTAGSAIIIEVKSNVTSNLNAIISVGYSDLYDDKSYESKYYRYGDFDSVYHTNLLAVERVRYRMIPFHIGAEYVFLRSNFTPFGVIKAGYNLSASEAEGINYDGIAGTFNTIDEIPEEYRKPESDIDDGSSFTLGIGFGIKYRFTERMDLNIRYIYNYNKAIINNNQILLGFTF